VIERHPVTDRATWLAMRAQDITASDIAAAVGLDPHKTALKLYGEKTGLLLPDGDNAMMRRGRWLESAVLAALQEQHPDWAIRQPKVYIRDTDLRLGATPDAIAQVEVNGGIVNVQCKVVSRPVYERDWADGVPMHYQLQTLTEGMLLDVERSMVAALVIDTYSAELYLHDVPRHAAAEDRIRQIATEFWANVAAGKAPAPDYKRDAETIAALYPKSEDVALDLTGDNELAVLLPERAVLKEMLKVDTDRLMAIDAEIKAKLGNAERATLPGWRLSWKLQHRKEQIMPASSFRVLRVTEVDIEEKAA
jgi:putative phage-type endonuclease